MVTAVLWCSTTLCDEGCYIPFCQSLNTCFSPNVLWNEDKNEFNCGSWRSPNHYHFEWQLWEISHDDFSRISEIVSNPHTLQFLYVHNMLTCYTSPLFGRASSCDCPLRRWPLQISEVDLVDDLLTEWQSWPPIGATTMFLLPDFVGQKVSAMGTGQWCTRA